MSHAAGGQPYKIAIFAIVMMIVAVAAHAVPQIAAEFHGKVYVDGKKAKIGTNITAVSEYGIECGKLSTRSYGEYGLLSCSGDDLSTEIREGLMENDKVRFYVDGVEAQTDKDAIWGQGKIDEINLFVLKRSAEKQPRIIRTRTKMDNVMITGIVALLVGLIYVIGVIVALRK